MITKQIKERVIFLTLFLLCPISLNGCSSKEEGFKLSLPFGKKYDYDNILLKKAIDGDTIQLEDGQRVRLIGIDTPEIHFSERLYKQAKRSDKDMETIKTLGKEAAQFTEKLVEGKKVRLELDIEKYDKYNRLLAYAYLKDGTFINAEIVRQGYALILTIPPNVKYKDVFLKAQEEAKENNRGLWGE